MADYTSAAMNYMIQQQQNAYQVDLMNYANKYNSPAQQMLRYQQAGLNPNLIYGQQTNAVQTPGSASMGNARSAGTAAKTMQTVQNALFQGLGLMKEIAEYMDSGRDSVRWKTVLTQQQGEAQSLENIWNSWLIGRTGDNGIKPDAPRRITYVRQQDLIDANYRKAEALISATYTGEDRTKALKALDDARLSILNGQYGAINSINTGNDTMDSILKMILYYLSSQSLGDYAKFF